MTAGTGRPAETGLPAVTGRPDAMTGRQAMTGFQPIRVCEVELSERLPAIEGYETARVLARWYGEPLALVDVPLTGGTAAPGELARALWSEVWPLVARRFAEAARQAGKQPGEGADDQAPGMLPVTGLRLASPSPFLAGRAETLAKARPASVIVCTRDRAGRLASCLAAVVAQDYPDFEVIVVDNAPADDRVAELVAGQTWPVPVRRVVEPRPGLARARNTGLRAAAGAFVAYLDDDEHPDRHWLAELARAFTLAPGVEGVSGLVLPASLDTPAQCLFERFGGHSKGRGLTAEVFDPASHARQHPLYPLPPFGVGASMAFDRYALARAGGFDVALGAGAPARAGEDTAAISDLMLRGGTFVYWPAAIMWHEHRRDIGEMERQLYGYGAGLTAFYLRALLRDPRLLPAIARLAPRALRDLRGRDSVRTATMGQDYPAALRRATRRGMLAGPALYLRGKRRQARQAKDRPAEDWPAKDRQAGEGRPATTTLTKTRLNGGLS